jgi:hypothetical protein
LFGLYFVCMSVGRHGCLAAVGQVASFIHTQEAKYYEPEQV